jgi:hypothetical protein
MADPFARAAAAIARSGFPWACSATISAIGSSCFVGTAYRDGVAGRMGPSAGLREPPGNGKSLP